MIWNPLYRDYLIEGSKKLGEVRREELENNIRQERYDAVEREQDASLRKQLSEKKNKRKCQQREGKQRTGLNEEEKWSISREDSTRRLVKIDKELVFMYTNVDGFINKKTRIWNTSEYTETKYYWSDGKKS